MDVHVSINPRQTAGRHELAPSGAQVPEVDPEFRIEGEAEDDREQGPTRNHRNAKRAEGYLCFCHVESGHGRPEPERDEPKTRMPPRRSASATSNAAVRWKNSMRER
jgi:hypothetical protein